MLSSVVDDLFHPVVLVFPGVIPETKENNTRKKKRRLIKSFLIYLKCHNFDFHSSEFSLLQKKTTLLIKADKIDDAHQIGAKA